MAQTVRVAAAIIFADHAHGGRMLAGERRPGVAMAGGWELPGGKIEAQESAEEALRREIREELGVGLCLVSPFATIAYDYPSFSLSMTCFSCAIAHGDEPRPIEHARLRWLSRNELSQPNWLPADIGLIERIGTSWDELLVKTSCASELL